MRDVVARRSMCWTLSVTFGLARVVEIQIRAKRLLQLGNPDVDDLQGLLKLGVSLYHSLRVGHIGFVAHAFFAEDYSHSMLAVVVQYLVHSGTRFEQKLCLPKCLDEGKMLYVECITRFCNIGPNKR